jgi:competence protein ComEC
VINFKAIPFLKIIVPYIAGIIFLLNFGLLPKLHSVFLASIITWTISFILQCFSKQNNQLKKIIYIASTNFLLFVLAHEASFLYNAKNNNNHYSHYVSSQPQSFFTTINDIPVITEKFIKLSVTINSVEFNKKWHYTNGNTIIYLKNDSILKPVLGNTLFLKAKFSFVNTPKNPNEFNYKSFLENKNIFHTVYANPADVQLISRANTIFRLTELGTKIKSHLVSVLRNSKLSQEAFSICSALLVGYDDEIESDVMQSFSHSGTLHILSVSGMHTGVLYAILIFIFSKLDKYDRYKKTKFAVILLFLILFVFITGFSPSILRAALMLTLVLFGKTFYKQGNSFNTLFLSAFLLLLYNPYLIIDVGFLLSYFAVFGIMYFYPLLNKLYVFDNKIAQWLWTSVLISVAATLFTLPISLYFFHQFPIWFALSNLIIIPISMLVMIAAICFIALYKLAIVNQVLVYTINASTSLMLWFAKLTDNSTYGFIDFIPFSFSDIVFMTISIGLCLIIIYRKQYNSVLALCFTIIAWLSVSIYSNYQQSQQNQLIIFHVKHKSFYALRVGQCVYADFYGINQNEFQRNVKPYLLTISNLKIIQTKSSILKVDSSSVLNVSQPNTHYPFLNANYIIVSNDVPIELTTNYKTKSIIIADCSNSYKFVKRLKKECALLEVPFYSVKETGAVQINL